jgi:predicted N-formylglutamate amidohydrolase
MSEVRLVVSCEHASNQVPPRYRDLFPKRVLASHRGWDPGALAVARRLAQSAAARLHAGEVSRLLVDLNRSRHHPRLFSEYVRELDSDARAAVVQRYYQPYRDALEADIRARTGVGFRVLHLSVHSFVPIFHGVRRNADVGLLYDPARSWERRLAVQLRERLIRSGFRVRRNYPYRGTADGLTTHLRSVFPRAFYAGLEIELNQALLRKPDAARAVAATLRDAIGSVRAARLS